MALNNTHNLEMRQGDDFSFIFTVADSGGTAFDLTGYTARLQVRKTFAATTALIEASTVIGNLVITSLSGIVTWSIADTDTTGIKFTEEEDVLECVYDLELIDAFGKVTCPARGTFTLYREVTKDAV